MPYVRTAGGLVECAIRGRHTNQRQVTNMWHVFVDPDISESRAEAVVRAAETVRDSWQENMIPQLGNNYTLEEVGFIDLDSLTGTTGQVSPNPGLPIVGTQTSETEAPQVTYLFHKVTLAGRQERNGRMYFSPVISVSVDEDGVVSGASQTAANAAAAAFQSDIDTASAFTEIDSRVGHWQIPPGDPPPQVVEIVGTSTSIVSFLIDPVVATQRRRVRG